ncbi:MBL fold metallo-hydrolase [Taklimakanibacter deserti]|uniref:MBL fold metallo-hydrolase n=1 Tax=Taklimakanibacter deserti TaxID=2267839 RepID=UPI000E653796
MLDLSRRHFFLSAAVATAAFGLNAKLLIPSAFAGTGIDPEKGFYKYKVGEIEVTALYDGIWRKPHDPAFIKNASVAETKEALAQAGLPTDYMPIPLTIVVVTVGDRHIMVDSGSGAQWQPTAGRLHENMAKARIDPDRIETILISHFHPDHIFGLMHKGSNAPFFPKAELIVSATEYKWWTEPGRVDKLPEARKALGKRINAVFPKWKNFTLVEGEKEVAPGVTLVSTPGHTPGHSAFLVSSGDQQLMISNDVAYVPALLAPHPDWQGAYDQDGPLAVQTRKSLIDRIIADKLMVCGAHFPFPGAGSFAKDGAAYAFTPVSS